MPFLSHSLRENKGHLLKDLYMRVNGCSLSRPTGNRSQSGEGHKRPHRFDLEKVHAVCYLKASTWESEVGREESVLDGPSCSELHHGGVKEGS